MQVKENNALKSLDTTLLWMPSIMSGSLKSTPTPVLKNPMISLKCSSLVCLVKLYFVRGWILIISLDDAFRLTIDRVFVPSIKNYKAADVLKYEVNKEFPVTGYTKDENLW